MSLSAAVVRELIAAGLAGDSLVAACERIEASEATKVSSGAIRTARWRAKKAAEAVTVTSHPSQASHEEGFPHTPSEENPSTKEKPLRGKKKAVPLPDDFQPDIEWAMAQGLSRSQAEMQAASFCDFWRGAKDGLKSDWPATWRNRVRNFIERTGIQPPKPVATNAAKAPEELEKHWIGRLEYGRTHGKWLCDQWGPMPGIQGCRAPPELLKPGDGNGWSKWESAA
jgi:hypothetical protein